MAGEVTQIRRVHVNEPAVYREVAITKDTRDALEEIATLLRKHGFPINAAITERVVDYWDRNEATEQECEGEGPA